MHATTVAKDISQTVASMSPINQRRTVTMIEGRRGLVDDRAEVVRIW